MNITLPISVIQGDSNDIYAERIKSNYQEFKVANGWSEPLKMKSVGSPNLQTVSFEGKNPRNHSSSKFMKGQQHSRE